MMSQVPTLLTSLARFPSLMERSGVRVQFARPAQAGRAFSRIVD